MEAAGGGRFLCVNEQLLCRYCLVFSCGREALCFQEGGVCVWRGGEGAGTLGVYLAWRDLLLPHLWSTQKEREREIERGWEGGVRENSMG